MTVHTIIESLSAYQAVRSIDPLGERVWWTTSPYLLVHLDELGESVRSPEDGLDDGTFNALAVAGFAFATNLCCGIQASVNWSDQFDVAELLAGQVGRLFFATFYKGLLLDRVVVAAGSEPLVCVGDPD